MSGFALKIIAIISMTIDHLFKIAPNIMESVPKFAFNLPGISLYFPGVVSLLGRLAFPLFAFGVAEGCVHTKNFPKYLRRLFIFALLSELPFDYMLRGGFTMYSQNVMWTFFFGVFAIYLYEKLKSTRILGVFSVFVVAVVCYLFNTDYKSLGVVLIFAMYVIRNKPLKISAVFILICLYYFFNRGLYNDILSGNTKQIISQCMYLFATLLSVPLIASYNGKKGLGMKWFFYFYYPLHLLVLGWIDKIWMF